MTRHLQKELKFLMAAMIIIGAGSAFAQSENLTEGTDPSVSQSESDYFSLTKNAGTESESMRKIEVITLFNANNLPSAKQLALGQLQASLLGSRLTAALEIPNNSLTHSLTHSLTILL